MIKCLAIDDEPLALRQIAAYIAKLPSLHLAASCNNALEAQQLLAAQPVDLIFVDINMPDLNGVEFVRTLTEQPAPAAANADDEEYPETYSRLVEQLEKFFSQEISIKRSKNGGGKITIGFADDKDIERFIERFSARS